MKDMLQSLHIPELKDWLYGLQPREKLYLLGGVAALTLLVVYLSLWQPLSSSVARLNETSIQQQKDIAWMQAASSSIGQLQQNSQRRGANRSMLSAVDQAINTANLKAGLERMEPDGQNSVKLWLTKSPFDEIVAMLGQLEQTQGIAVQTLAMTTSADGAGLVEARITLVRGGS
jgi:general secretion pathway protein M